jgi:hypothetical protein
VNISRSGIGRILITTISLFAILSATGCAGGPAGRELPSWVLSPPPPDDTYEYFVVSAEDATGNYVRAEEAAGLNLLAEIDRVLGVDVSVITDAEVRGSLDDYEAEVRSAVRQVGSGTIAGLRIADRYVLERDGSVVIYVLASYERSALNEEQSRRRELLAEREAEVSLPERQGQAAEQQGRLYEAFRYYVAAAVAASNSDIRNADVKLDQNMQNALRVLSSVRIVPQDQPDELYFGRPVEGRFEARVVSSGSDPVPEAAVTVSWRETVGGRARQATDRLVSDASGVVSFSPASAGSPGTQFVTMYLDIQPELESLRRAGLGAQPQFGSIENLAADIRVRFEYQVLSLAPTVPTAVVYLEQDIAGLSIGSSGVRDGILQELATYDFRIIELPAESRDILQEGGAALLDWVRRNHSDSIERVVYGTAAIVEVDERDGYIVKVQGDVQVYDLNEDRSLLRSSGVKNSRGTSSSRAVSSAFFNLGRDFGAYIVNNLP